MYAVTKVLQLPVKRFVIPTLPSFDYTTNHPYTNTRFLTLISQPVYYY